MKRIMVNYPDNLTANWSSDGQGGNWLNISEGTVIPPIVVPPHIDPGTGPLPEYNLPWPIHGQWQIPTDTDQAKLLPELTAALENWQDGYINFTVPADLPFFDNHVHFGQLKIVPGLFGNLPSGVLTVDGGNPLPFASEFPDWGWSIDNPGSQAFNMTRGSVGRLRLTASGPSSFVLVFATPTRGM